MTEEYTKPGREEVQEQEPTRWYNSFLVQALGVSSVIISSGLGIKLFCSAISSGLESKVITRNVIGEQVPEKFIETSRGRAYLEIDGVSVEEYLMKKRDDGEK